MSFSPVVASSRFSPPPVSAREEDNENDESELPSETELENGIVNVGNKAEDLGDDAVSVCSAFSDLEYGLESGSGSAVGAGAGGAGKEDEDGDVMNMSASATRVATPPKAPGGVRKSSPLKVCHEGRGLMGCTGGADSQGAFHTEFNETECESYHATNGTAFGRENGRASFVSAPVRNE